MKTEILPFPTKKAAAAVVAGLGKPSKMPGKAYGLPAAECGVGSKLRQIPGSTCSDCYACKGRYSFDNVQDAQYRRLATLDHPDWPAAMVTLIKPERWFRWHDSGDLRDLRHLEMIAAVAANTPDTRHWLPTREKGILAAYKRKHGDLPANLVVRLSAAMIDGKAPRAANTSTVHAKRKPQGFECKAYTRKGKCGDCRACWDPAIKNVSYPQH